MQNSVYVYINGVLLWKRRSEIQCWNMSSGCVHVKGVLLRKMIPDRQAQLTL